MFKSRAPYANRLARHLKSWHTLQGERLSLGRCQHIVAVLHGHANWVALLGAAATHGEPEVYTPKIERLTRLGYPADDAEKLVTFLARVASAPSS
jgi:hypothetical protein